MNKLLGLVLLALSVMEMSVSAAVTGSVYDGTFYDALPSNTAATSGVSPWYYNANGGTVVNTQWRYREGFGTVAIFEADGSGNDAGFYGEKPEIYTTISGLVPGMSYEIDAIFWSNNGGTWRIRAGLASGVLTEYIKATAPAVATGGIESDRFEYAAPLGVATADANGQIKVYVDDNDPAVAADDQGNRVWYDGLVYKMVSPAYSPEPADGTSGVATDNVSLSWLAGRNVAGTAINPEIARHYLAYSIDEPNFIDPIEITTLSSDPISYTVGSLLPNSTYYWAVYTVVGGGDFGDPNCLTGVTWSFETIKTLPSFDLGSHPQDMLGESGSVVLLTASAAVQSGSSDITYQWYKGLPGIYTEPVGTTQTTAELSLTLSVSNDGYYFCQAINTAGSVDSKAALVQTKRILGSYAFDNTLAETSGGPAVVMPATVYSTDTPYTTSTASLSFNGSTPATIDGSLMVTNDITLSAWFKYSSVSAHQRIYDFGNGTGEYIFLTPTNGSNMRFAIKTVANGSEQGLIGAVPAVNQWNHVVVTIGGDTGTMYLNGIQVAQSLTMTANPREVNCSTSYLADSQWPDDPFYTGLIDDLVVYNYALSADEVAELYTSSTGTSICITPIEMDIAGPDGVGVKDCKVDMYDFAALAQMWLKCNIYPQSSCFSD
ncbi:MAG: hypothetical protein JW745_04325 [Sedimentisphaerales bacterium]|nr:hypothetical protein [Sedimentisphaerales bacterium]MBN2844248.1 hypothetical protein [Sedimentisphaerales bacterium]